MNSEQIPFLVNLAARRAATWPRIVSDLRALGVAVRPVPVAAPHAWVAAVAREAAARPPALLLGGGDGSFSSALAPLLNSDTVAGFIPLGTGNGIARSFGISSPAAACRAIAAGHVCSVSVARANHAPFLNLASFGISVAVTTGLHPGLKRLLGHGAYPLSIARALVRRRPFDLTLELDDATLAVRAVQVIVFNGRYAARPPALGRVLPGSVLTVCVLADASLPRLALAVLGFWAGSRAERPALLCRETAHVRLVTAPRLPANIDGEIVEHTPLDVYLLPNALRVFALQGC